jgi:hypothetical protein
MEQNPESSLFEMELDGKARNHLNIISKWSKFISIAGFSLVGLVSLVVAWIYIKTEALFQVYLGYLFAEADAKSWLFIALIILSVLLLLVWLVILLRLSIQLRNAIRNNNTIDLSDAFKSLRVFFVVTIANTALAVLFTIYSLITNPF